MTLFRPRLNTVILGQIYFLNEQMQSNQTHF